MGIARTLGQRGFKGWAERVAKGSAYAGRASHSAMGSGSLLPKRAPMHGPRAPAAARYGRRAPAPALPRRSPIQGPRAPASARYGRRGSGLPAGARGHPGAGGWVMPSATRPISQGGARLPKRKSIMGGSAGIPRPRPLPAWHPPAVAPPPRSKLSAAMKQHKDKASAHVLKHKLAYAGGGAAALGTAAYMTRRGPGTGQSTGGVPTGMYGY